MLWQRAFPCSANALFVSCFGSRAQSVFCGAARETRGSKLTPRPCRMASPPTTHLTRLTNTMAVSRASNEFDLPPPSTSTQKPRWRPIASSFLDDDAMEDAPSTSVTSGERKVEGASSAVYDVQQKELQVNQQQVMDQQQHISPKEDAPRQVSVRATKQHSEYHELIQYFPSSSHFLLLVLLHTLLPTDHTLN